MSASIPVAAEWKWKIENPESNKIRRKRKSAPPIDPKKWKEHRDVITNMYLSGKKAEEVITHIKENFKEKLKENPDEHFKPRFESKISHPVKILVDDYSSILRIYVFKLIIY